MKSFKNHLVEETHTHKGHCQACGRTQAVGNEKEHIAKHGYTIPGWGQGGYFHGTCHGSDCKPLEKDRSLTDTLVKGMHEQAAYHHTLQHQYEAKTIQGTHVHAYHLGSPQYEKREYGKKSQPKMKPWAEATEHEKEHFYRRGAYEHKQARDWLKSHAKDMTELASRVHGQPLRPNQELNAPPAPTVQKGTHFKIEHEHRMKDEHGNEVLGKHGKIQTYKKVHEYEVGEPHQGLKGWNSSRSLPHFVVHHIESGKKHVMSKREITKHLKNSHVAFVENQEKP